MGIRIRRPRRITLVSFVAVLGVAVAGTGCSSNDDSFNTDTTRTLPSSAETLPTEASTESTETSEPTIEASIAPTPPLEADPADSAPAKTKDKSNPARQVNLVSCEQALSLKVINRVVPGTSTVSLDEVDVNRPNSSFVRYSETCTYTVRGADDFDTDVAYVTSMLLTDAGKEHYRKACNGREEFVDVIVNPIGYQRYGHVDDGCTLTPRRKAPKDTLPGCALRYRGQRIVIRLEGFDKLAKDGKAVIREAKLK